ncbi:MAG: hypothetical protein JWR21_699 [Herminiimonas sp.]|nr:hypothetical protein [Herminiimonas sp.]MDB5855223.1 hypothetical protein [Herminiimonas sp.]
MQEVIVALIVLTAAVTLLRRYLPASVRRLVATTLARHARFAGMERLASRLEREPLVAAPSCDDGCGSCGGCGSKSPQAVQARSGISVDALRKTAHK